METKIDRGFFNTQDAYRKMMIGESVDESKGIDEESYKAYIVVKCKDGTEKIESGWDFSEDAKDRKNELKEEGIQSKSVSRRYLKSVGLDPTDDSNWLKGNVETLVATKNESAEIKVVTRAKDILESSEYNKPMTTIDDWIAETFKYQIDSDSKKVSDYVRRFLSERGYDLSSPIGELDEGLRIMLEDNAGDILNPLESKNL